MREVTRPSTAKCTLPMYIAFLISEPKSPTCTRLEEVTGISHDSVNRFLHREFYQPKDIFDEVSKEISLIGGTLSIDDTVLDKPYSFSMDLVGHFWSGKHHKAVKGINLITLYYTARTGEQFPVNFRIYDKTENKTKNDYFLEMLDEALSWGIEADHVTGDSWYSCVPNLKAIRNHQLGFMFAVKSNRLISLEKGKWQQISSLEIPESGLVVWLKNFGEVKVFSKQLKDQMRYYILYSPKDTLIKEPSFIQIHDQHWQIEQYHRALKQVCHIEHFQVRTERPIRNHIFAAIFAYCYLQKMVLEQVISTIYQHYRELFKDVTASFIVQFIKDKDHLLPKISFGINA